MGNHVLTGNLTYQEGICPVTGNRQKQVHITWLGDAGFCTAIGVVDTDEANTFASIAAALASHGCALGAEPVLEAGAVTLLTLPYKYKLIHGEVMRYFREMGVLKNYAYAVDLEYTCAQLNLAGTGAFELHQKNGVFCLPLMFQGTATHQPHQVPFYTAEGYPASLVSVRPFTQEVAEELHPDYYPYFEGIVDAFDLDKETYGVDSHTGRLDPAPAPAQWRTP